MIKCITVMTEKGQTVLYKYCVHTGYFLSYLRILWNMSRMKCLFTHIEWYSKLYYLFHFFISLSFQTIFLIKLAHAIFFFFFFLRAIFMIHCIASLIIKIAPYDPQKVYDCSFRFRVTFHAHVCPRKIQNIYMYINILLNFLIAKYQSLVQQCNQQPWCFVI